MNKDNAKDFLPLVQALADGKTIQFRTGSEWRDVDDPLFALYPANFYRVKPEPVKPREWFLSLEADGSIWDAGTAKGNLIIADGGRVIRVRES